MTIKEVEVNTDFRKEIVSKIGKYYLEDLIRISNIKYGNETDEGLQRAHEDVLKRSGSYADNQPKKKLWEIWMSGYRFNGDRGTASKLDEIEAESFEDAVRIYFDKKGMIKEYIPGKSKIFGCGLYDNEKDARRFYG